MLVSLIAFILILSILVFVHELGHFAVAKWCGMRVDEFGIGFPPHIWTKRKGDTLYCVNAIPLGGYVKIHGESPSETDRDPKSFQHKPVWQRIAVILAGVTMNLLFAFLALTIAFSVGFVSVAQNLENTPGAVVKNSQIIIAEVQPGSAAEKGGLKQGDEIISIVDMQTGQETKFTSLKNLQEYTRSHQQSGSRDLSVRYVREGSSAQTGVTLASTDAPLGVGLDSFGTVRVPVWRAPGVALKEMGYIIEVTWNVLKNFWSNLFIHAKFDENVSGPIGIYKATATATHQGVIPVVFLMISLSINLALLNVLPVPALDGGKFVFLLTELIFRKRVVAEHIENWITMGGFIFLIGLILVITVHDIIKFF